MGLVVCEQHGGGFMYVCPHVVAAISTDSARRDIRYLEFAASDDEELADLTLAGWFCACCIDGYHLPTDGCVTDADSFLEGASAVFRPMCPGCFEDWRSRVNEER